MAKIEPKSPGDVLATLNASKEDNAKDIHRELGLDPHFKFVEAPRSRVNINGFETLVAADVFKDTGNLDKAQRANVMVRLLGDELYKNIKTAANCSGLDDEAAFLRQKLWELFERDTFDAEGATSPFAKDVDGNPASTENKLINEVLGKSNLGRLVQYAKANDISNIDALRYGVLNYLTEAVARGF